MQPHQERLVVEHKENAEKMERLRTFINGPVFPTVDAEEQKRMYRQCGLMIELEKVHAERIAAFKDEPAAEVPVIENDIAAPADSADPEDEDLAKEPGDAE